MEKGAKARKRFRARKPCVTYYTLSILRVASANDSSSCQAQGESMPYPTVMHSPNGSHVSRGPEVKGEREGQGEEKERSFLCLDSGDGTLRWYQHGSSLVDTATLCSVEMTRCEWSKSRRGESSASSSKRVLSLGSESTRGKCSKLSWCAISEELSLGR